MGEQPTCNYLVSHGAINLLNSQLFKLRRPTLSNGTNLIEFQLKY